MAFFDELGKTITDIGKDAAQKTKDALDVLQMKAQMGSEKSKVRELYAVIGESYYEGHKEEAKVEYASVCGQIQSTLDKITDLEEKIRNLDNTVTCPSCGAVLDKDFAYCSKCGAALTPAEPEEEEVAKAADAADASDIMVEPDTPEEDTPEAPSPELTVVGDEAFDDGEEK